MYPFVSVVMNTLRDGAAFDRALASYQAQQRVRLQLIVSTVPDDPAVAKTLAAGAQVIVGPAGIYAQLNRALPLVEGDWFAYASGNDYAAPDKLVTEASCCKKAGAGVCYSAYVQVYDGKSLLVSFPVYSYRRHLQGNFVSDCSMMSAGLLKKYGPFRTRFKNKAFWDFWLRVAEGEGERAFTRNPRSTWFYCVTRSSRHQRRKRDPAWRREEDDSVRMVLEAHRA